MNAVVEAVEREMGEDIFSANGESLEEVVLLLLGLSNATLSTAESCTGGLLAQRLTAIQNASRSFVGGSVVYNNEIKTRCADVPAEAIASHGAVSEAVARLLAEGVRKRMGTTLASASRALPAPLTPKALTRTSRSVWSTSAWRVPRVRR